MPGFRPSLVPTANPTGAKAQSPSSGALVADAISLTIHPQHATRPFNKRVPHGNRGIAHLASSTYGELLDRFDPPGFQEDLLDDQWLAFPDGRLHDP